MLDPHSLETWLKARRFVLIVEKSHAAFQEATDGERTAWCGMLAQEWQLPVELVRKWYDMSWRESLFDMLHEEKAQYEAGRHMCYLDLGEQSVALVPLLPLLGIEAARALQRCLPLERRLEVARGLDREQAVEVLGSRELDRPAVEFLLTLMTPAEGNYLVDSALSQVSLFQPELYREVVVPHLRSEPPDSSLSLVYHLAEEDLAEFIALLRRDFDRAGIERSKAFLFLCRLGAIEPLAHLHDSDPYVRAEVVRRVPPEQSDRVAELLDDPEEIPRQAAVDQLIEWDKSEYAERLAALQDDESDSLRRSLKAAFKKWKFKPAKQPRLTAEQRLRKELGQAAESILAAGRWSVRAQSAPARALPLGDSRLGGSPDLPAEQEWPAGMAFVAQFNLSQCPKLPDLPSAGWLVFFVSDDDLLDGADCRVLLLDPQASLVARTAPEGCKTYPGRSLKLKKEFSLPGAYSALAHGLEVDLRKRYRRILDDLDQGPEDVQHRLLGVPAPIQDDFLAGDSERYLLCQIDSEPKIGLFWGDSGRLYFIGSRQQGLSQDVYLEAQCY